MPYLAGAKLRKQALNPGKIPFGRRRMPSVQQIELDRALVASPSRHAFNLVEWLHRPARTVAREAEKAGDVVPEDGGHEMAAVDETCGLEDPFVLILELLFAKSG